MVSRRDDARQPGACAAAQPAGQRLQLLLIDPATQIRSDCVLFEGTVRKHLENIHARLQVTSRTGAVTRAFPSAPHLSSPGA